MTGEAATMSSEERSARVTWARISEPADEQAAVLCAAEGHVGALLRVRAGDVPAATRDQRWQGWRTRAERVDIGREREMTARAGARIVFPGDPEWPARLDELTVPPHCLWVVGDADLAAVIVSGAAFGIDAAAHRGALAADGTTVALLACGLDRDYPAAHAGLLRDIRRDGLVVSELPIGSAPLRTRFLARNRIIAALTRGTLVVEAGLRSGSLNTAGHAVELGRAVCAVPGPVGSHVSAGCHQLIRDGGILVTDAAEVAEAIGGIGEAPAPVKEVRGPDADWSPLDRQVHAVVPVRSGWPVDRIVKEVGCAPLAVMASLGRLEGEGAIRLTERGWQKQPAGRPRAAARDEA